MSTRVRNKDKIQANRIKMFEYLAQNPCVDCNCSDLRVLTFDHIRDKTARVMEEIDKCQVRCANCHMLSTQERTGHYRIAFYNSITQKQK